MLEDLMKWLIGTIGVGTVAGLVVAAVDYLRRRREAIVSAWAWYEVAGRRTDGEPHLHLVLRNRSPYDLIIMKIAIVDTPFGHIAFSGGGDSLETSVRVRPGPPFSEVPPSAELEFAMREDGMLPKRLGLSVHYWTSQGGEEGTFITRRVPALMA